MSVKINACLRNTSGAMSCWSDAFNNARHNSKLVNAMSFLVTQDRKAEIRAESIDLALPKRISAPSFLHKL